MRTNLRVRSVAARPQIAPFRWLAWASRLHEDKGADRKYPNNSSLFRDFSDGTAVGIALCMSTRNAIVLFALIVSALLGCAKAPASVTNDSPGPDTIYHTAKAPSADGKVRFEDGTVVTQGAQGGITFAAGRWKHFSDAPGSNQIALDQNAYIRFLHTDGGEKNSANDNSIVARLGLGKTSLLLVGDAGSGEDREDPTSAEKADGIEQYLLDHHRADINVDILQVGHHGSKTSSRTVFLDAVSPKIALIGAGTTLYHGNQLPDFEVNEALDDAISGNKYHPDMPAPSEANQENLAAEQHQNIYRTDVHDEKSSNGHSLMCQDGNGHPVADRIGIDNERPGGCDNFIVTVN